MAGQRKTCAKIVIFQFFSEYFHLKNGGKREKKKKNRKRERERKKERERSGRRGAMGTTVVEGVVAATKERRVVVVPSSQENKKLSIVTLPEPKDGKPREYAVGEGVVLEANWFRRKNASWFIGNDVVSDGGITLYTKVNPIFFVLPSLAGCGQQNMKQQNMFCTLEHILESSGLPRQETFEALLEKSLSDVCDTKEVGDEVYFRFSIDKVGPLALITLLFCRPLPASTHTHTHCC